MSKEYYSKLISDLYSITESMKMLELLEEIEEINDPIFLYPLYDVYKKNIDKSHSHYFLAAINKINSNDSINIAIEIGLDPNTNLIDRTFALDIFKKRKFIDKTTIDIANKILKDIVDHGTEAYTLRIVISYFKDADLLSDIEDYLVDIYLNDRFSTEARTYAFSKWLEIDAKARLQNLIDNYDNAMNNHGFEIIVAKALSTWKGIKVNELQKIIIAKGGLKAKSITERALKKKEEEDKKEKEEKHKAVQKEYSNADLIDAVSRLRNKINTVTISHQEIGFIIFPHNETILLQLKTATDEAALKKACTDLRELIQDLNKDLKNHGLEKEIIKKLLPNTVEQDFHKSMNSLLLFLHAKGFKVDSNLFGLRRLNQVVGLLGAHSNKEQKKILAKLKELHLHKIYQNEDWVSLHRGILLKYSECLEKMLVELNQK